MSTLTPLRPATVPKRAASDLPKLSSVARRTYHVVQTIWLVAMVVIAIGAGHTLGYIALWALGAGLIATLDFGYREYVLHDHPSSSL